MNANKLQTIIAKSAEKYSERYELRAAVQAIPYIGGPLDTILGGYGSNIQQKRIFGLLEDLKSRLNLVTAAPLQIDEEAFFDLMVNAFDGVLRTRNEEKRRLYANLIATQIIEGRSWDEAEAACRLLDSLTEIHVLILKAALNSKECSEPFSGMKVISLSNQDDSFFGNSNPISLMRPLNLRQVFPTYSSAALKMYCSELLSKGLLHDEGIGRWDASAMEYLIPTELAAWFIGWLEEPLAT